MPGRRVLLIVNPDKANAVAAVERARSAIEAHAEFIGVREVDSLDVEEAKDAEVVVALGGDGTLLALARRLNEHPRPLLGVNLGRVGFLAEFDLDAFEAQAAELFDSSRPLKISLRPLMEATVRGADGGVRARGLALNDAVVTAGPPFRMIEVALRIGGEEGPNARGDGVVVATPFGSTAHNASAGGPIIVPEVDALAVTPIAAHSLSFRPLVAPKDAEVELRMLRVNQSEAGGTTLVLDGQEQIPLAPGDTLTCRLGDRTAPLVRNPEWSYWRTLMGKLHWAAEPRGHGEASQDC